MPFLQQGTATAPNSRRLLAARPDSTRQSRTRTRRSLASNVWQGATTASSLRGDGATDVPMVSCGGTNRRTGGMALQRLAGTLFAAEATQRHHLWAVVVGVSAMVEIGYSMSSEE